MPMRTWFRRLADPRSLTNAVTWAGLGGALALVDPAGLTPAGRLALRCATAAVVGAGIAAEVSADDSDLAALTPIALPVGAAGLVLGLADVNEAWDRATIRFLERTGVPKPRLVLAAGTVVASLGAFALGRRMPSPPEAPEQDPRLDAVPAEVRSLVLGMLMSTEGHSSDVLRGQLDQAQVRTWPDGDDISWAIDFDVADDVPLAIPHSFTFPVRARFSGKNGHPLQALLLVEEGVLNAIMLDTVPDEDFGDDGWPSEHFERWPVLDDVTFVFDPPTRTGHG